MTWIPSQPDYAPLLGDLYTRFQDAVAAIAGKDPEDDLVAFGAFLLLRDALFEGLGVPVTGHNSLRLFDTAYAGGLLSDFLMDADHFFPETIVGDEALLLSALATYCGWRDVRDTDARVYDIEAFLDVRHHRHNTAAITAWLDGTLGYNDLRSALSSDERWLEHAVC